MPDARPPDPVERFIGYGLATVGGLMLGLAGLCSAGFGVMTLSNARSAPFTASGVMGFLVTIGIFGGIPMGVGALILRWGRRVRSLPEPREWPAQPPEPFLGMIGLAIGLVIAAAGVAGSAWVLAVTIPGILQSTGDNSFYALMFAPVAFFTGLVTVLGVWVVLNAYRLWRGPRRPPSDPPPG